MAPFERDPVPFYVGSEQRVSSEIVELHSPFDGRLVGRTHRATAQDVDDAIAAAEAAFPRMRALTAAARAQVLEKTVVLLRERQESLARMLCDEVGKPIRDARAEVTRAALTFTTAAAEALRIGGEWMPLDVIEATAGHWAIIRRFPLGPIGAISPFNFPLNLVAHKLAPAFAAGNTVVLKPSSAAPLTALGLARILYDAGLPEGALSVVPCTPQVGEQLATDARLRKLTFTGSPAVGWALKARAGRKRVTLELGGNAGVVVHRDADVKTAADRCAVGGFSFAGQVCISTQRIFVHEAVIDAFLHRFLERVRALRVGDPADDATDVGPMIHEAAARQAEAWIQEAVEGGARLLTGGIRRGTLLEPTVLADTRPEMKVNCREVFAPVVTVIPYTDIQAALRALDHSDFGLQAGLFTRDAGIIFQAYERTEVGGLIVNDIPTFRIDPMPYGGVKESGQGREGIRWAIEEMTEERTLVYKPIPLPSET